jgi:hypothetical protein
LALALLGALSAFVIGVTRGSLKKDPDVVITMAVLFAGVGAVTGWFGGRAADRLITTRDTYTSGASKVAGSAAGLGVAIGCLCGGEFGALGVLLGSLIGAAVFGVVGAGVGLLFVVLKR